MSFGKIIPCSELNPFIKYFIISKSDAHIYKVLPSAGLVMGFQYRGSLSAINDGAETNLSTAGVTGVSDTFKIFKNSDNNRTILTYFTEVGFAHFTRQPVDELFNKSMSLEHIFDKNKVTDTEEKLTLAKTDKQRISIVEQFLLSQLKDVKKDMLVIKAVKLIYESQGTIKIKELQQQLFISTSPLEKRFRKLVGTTPKKFASIIRFNRVLTNMSHLKTLTEICYEHNFFDQAHFIKDFKQYTGETPETFKRFL